MIVVARGQGYIVNPQSKQLLETFGGNIINVIDIPHFIKDTYYILLIHNTSLLCYDSAGFRWENTEILWNRVRELQFNDFRLTGEFYCVQEYTWKKFKHRETGFIKEKLGFSRFNILNKPGF